MAGIEYHPGDVIRSAAALALGLIAGAYWLRVVKMVKARRREGQDAQFIPREPVARILRMIWTPIIFVWVFYPFTIAFWRRPPIVLRPMYFNPWIAGPAVLVAALCFHFTRRCWKAMGRDWRMGIDPAEANPLIINGPFGKVRHPIYALSIAMMLATMAALPSPLMLAAGAMHIVLLVWESRREERHMLRIHGDQYLHYRASVAAFIPRLK